MSTLPIVLTMFAILSTPDLDQLSMLQAKAFEEKDGRIQTKMLAEVNSGLKKLIESDSLKTGKDFRVAASLVYSPNRYFEQTRVEYELLLTATKLGDPEAPKLQPSAWDKVLVSLGRNRRFGLEKFPGRPDTGLLKVMPSPKGVTSFLMAFIKGNLPTTAVANNPEITKIMDADQAARDKDFTKLKPEDWAKMALEDKERLKQMKKIVAKEGSLRTGEDFFNAALVFQHGAEFEDYATAHELALCSMILKANGGSWLTAAAYDRMLLNMGHRQRFGTQSYITLGQQFLSPLDENMINETVRFEVGRVRLSEIPFKRG